APRERHRQEARVASVEPEELPPGRDVPNEGRPRARGDEPTAVGAEGSSAHDGVVNQRRDPATRSDIPDASIVVVAGRREVPPIRAEGDGGHLVVMADERGRNGLAAPGVPDPCERVAAPGGKQLAV